MKKVILFVLAFLPLIVFSQNRNILRFGVILYNNKIISVNQQDQFSDNDYYYINKNTFSQDTLLQIISTEDYHSVLKGDNIIINYDSKYSWYQLPQYLRFQLIEVEPMKIAEFLNQYKN